MRLLLVEDDNHVAAALSAVLARHGFQVTHARSGEEALQALVPEGNGFGVVLLDLGLPRMDGYEVARRLREQPGLENVLLVALTGYGQEEDRRRSGEAGFDRHLVKPADSTALQDLLATSGIPGRKGARP